MASYKEIVTKAIVGKGKKYFKNNYNIEVSGPTNVLGCWVINHKFKGYKSGEKIGVDGSFDVNIWYSYEADSKTAVINKKIDYNDLFNVSIKEDADLTSDTDIIVRTLKQPTVTKVEIENGKVVFDIEKELGVEIVGETKMKIVVEDEEEPWEEINDELNETEEKIIDNNIQEDYLEESF
ncbi:MAG: outer spore coat protein CotE [Bacilli bacterium]